LAALLIQGPAFACNIDKERSEPDFDQTTAFVAANYNQKIFTVDNLINPGLSPDAAYLSMAEMYPMDNNCSYFAAAQTLIDLLQTTLKRHKANKVNDVTYFKWQGKSGVIIISVFKDWEENPFIQDQYQWDGKRFKFVKTEKFSS
jgi:hypothetical protein